MRRTSRWKNWELKIIYWIESHNKYKINLYLLFRNFEEWQNSKLASFGKLASKIDSHAEIDSFDVRGRVRLVLARRSKIVESFSVLKSNLTFSFHSLFFIHVNTRRAAGR